MKQTPEQWDSLVRRLNHTGCPVLADHSYKIAPVGLVIEKIPGLSFNSIFELANGGTGYAIELVIRNEANRAIDLHGFQIRTPWGIPMLSLLPAPAKSSPKYPHYSFPEPGPYYDGDWILNRIFAGRKTRLNPREERVGVLVASSEEMIPVEIPHLARIIAKLIIFDSRQNLFSAQFKLPVIRGQWVARKYSDGSRISTNARERSLLDPSLRPLVASPAPSVETKEEAEAAYLQAFAVLESVHSKYKLTTKPIETKKC